MDESNRTKWDPVVLVLIVANLAMFVVELASGVDPFKPEVDKVIQLGANFPPLTLHGEPWRLFTSMFLHYGIIHIAMNMLCLYQGRIVERLYGHIGFAAIYLVAGLAGSIASVLRATNSASAGASGAVFGVFGAFGAFIVLRRDRMNPEAVQKITRSLGSFFIINFAYGALTPGIDMSAHVGGLIGGFASGAALLAGQRADAQRVWRAIAVLVGGVALSVVAVFALQSRTSYVSVLDEFDKVQPVAINKFNELREQRMADKITDAQMADAIERDVLPPWQAIHKKFDDETSVPDEVRSVYNKFTRFVELRENAWIARVAALRDPTNTDKSEKAAKLDSEAAAAVSDLNLTMQMLEQKNKSR